MQIRSQPLRSYKLELFSSVTEEDVVRLSNVRNSGFTALTNN